MIFSTTIKFLFEFRIKALFSYQPASNLMIQIAGSVSTGLTKAAWVTKTARLIQTMGPHEVNASAGHDDKERVHNAVLALLSEPGGSCLNSSVSDCQSFGELAVLRGSSYPAVISAVIIKRSPSGTPASIKVSSSWISLPKALLSNR